LLCDAKPVGRGQRPGLSAIPNYGERRLADETISTSFVESAVNQVISKRMVKQQQMRWSPRGAHLLLQIRARVLNDTLTDDYRRPGRPVGQGQFRHAGERLCTSVCG
jgi:hypothetical protein